MKVYEAQVLEVAWQAALGRTAVIGCPPGAAPPPGRYALAWAPEDADAPLATVLFAGRCQAQGFNAAAPVPAAWEPGMALQLRGPLGHGFEPPPGMRRLALAAFSPASLLRLEGLLYSALAAQISVALYTNHAPEALPAAVEINPLAALPDALTWCDYLAADLDGEHLPHLRPALGLDRDARRLPCVAQALVNMPMPCGRMAQCGACAIETRHGWKLACEDGPVFAINELLRG